MNSSSIGYHTNNHSSRQLLCCYVLLLLTSCTMIQAASSPDNNSGEMDAGEQCSVAGVDSTQGGGHSEGCLPFTTPASLGKVTDNDPDFPSLFFMEDGTPVTSLDQWENERAPELLGFIESQLYGTTPMAAKNPANWTTSYSEEEEWDAVIVDGQPTCTMRQVKITWANNSNGRSATVDVISVLPKGQDNMPVLFMLNFRGNQAMFSDTRVRWTSMPTFHAAKAARRPPGTDDATFSSLAASKISFVTAHYREIFEDPDMNKNPGAPEFVFGPGGDFNTGVLGMFFKPGQTTQKSGEWGALGAWAWGASRILDYMIEVPELDGDRVLYAGLSRLGATAVWAGIQDDRFFAIANTSASGLAHRDGLVSYCNDSNLMAEKYEYWYEKDFRRGLKRAENTHLLRFDSHASIALQAPRPVMWMVGSRDCMGVTSGSINVDPEGSWDAVRYASDIYKHYNPDWAAKYDYMSEFSEQLPEQRVVVNNQIGFSIDPEGHNMDGADIETILIWAVGRGWLY